MMGGAFVCPINDCVDIATNLLLMYVDNVFHHIVGKEGLEPSHRSTGT